jgi:hypothetical protein
MALASSPDNIILGKGELFFDRFTAAGLRTGYFHLGNCQRFAVILNDDVISLNTSQDASGGLLKRVTRSREVAVEIGSNEFGIENLALGLMGDSGTLTQSSAAVTAEALATSIVPGRFYRTAGRNITGVVLNQGTATLTVGTDYTVYDSSAGLIQIKATGAATTAAATISYTRASLSLDTVLGATKTKVEGSLLFVPDPTTGPQFDVEVYKMSIAPGGEVGFISEEFGEYQVNGVALADTDGTYGGSASNPYFRLIQRGTA